MGFFDSSPCSRFSASAANRRSPCSGGAIAGRLDDIRVHNPHDLLTRWASRQPATWLPTASTRSRRRHKSGEHFLYNLAGDVGKAEVAALVAVRELEVIETEKMQQRGVEIVDVDRVFFDIPADVHRSCR